MKLSEDSKNLKDSGGRASSPVALAASLWPTASTQHLSKRCHSEKRSDEESAFNAGRVAPASRRQKPAQRYESLVKKLLSLRLTAELVEAAGVEPASENVTGQETTCVVAFMP